ncbi:MAG TPA: hypothetical protein VGF76_13725 [Polyangiaceae bacterium]
MVNAAAGARFSSPFLYQRANPTSFASLFIAVNNQLQSLSAEDDVLSSAGGDQIAAFEDEREQHQDESNESSGTSDIGGVTPTVMSTLCKV